MRVEGELVVVAGVASEAGRRADNQDFAGFTMASPLERMRHGMIAALADGVSGAKGGRIAAELAVRMVLQDYYAIPETIGPARAIHRVMAGYNRWLNSLAGGETMTGAASTFTAFALRGRRGHVAHVGDSRAWRFADERLTCLTRDHVRSEPDLAHVLIRALGIEDQLRLDHIVIELADHDRLVLTSDGVHGVLSDARIAAVLARRESAEAAARALVAEALAAGSQDNASALVLDIVALPAPDHDGIAATLAHLPIIAVPQVGDSIDGFQITSLVAEGRYTALFRAIDSADSSDVVLKFPRPGTLSAQAARLAFTREMLIAQRVNSPFVGAAYPMAAERQSALYGVQPFYVGETMAARLTRGLPDMERAIAQATQVVRAVAALHRLDIVHRDLKPDNIILTRDGGVKLIDLGVARLPNIEDFASDEIPGTPGHMAPEQFEGNAGDALTDQFALGVTLYRWLTGQWPFGEQEAFQRPRFGRVQPPSTNRQEIPSWLDAAILRALQTRRGDRFGDVVELLRALEGGGAVKRVPATPFIPLLRRNEKLNWQILSAALAIALIASFLLH